MSLLVTPGISDCLGSSIKHLDIIHKKFQDIPSKKKFGSEKEEKIIIVSFERYAQTNKQTDKLAYYIID